MKNSCPSPSACPALPFRSVALFGNNFQDKYLLRIKQLLEILSAKGFALSAESSFMTYLRNSEGDITVKIKEITAPEKDTDIVLSFGGDGTFLHAACWLEGRDIPVLGINTGHLGYLAGYSLDEPELIIDTLNGRNFIIDRRVAIGVECNEMPDGFWPYALNEVALLKEDTSSMIRITTHIDDFFLASYGADGLIVSTPTGSTGYNLSAGGPILQPGIEALALSPVAAHSLTLRPLVVSDKSVITVETDSRSATYRVSLDGRSFTLPCKTFIRIRRAPFTIPVVMKKEDNFASTLRSKLYWGHN